MPRTDGRALRLRLLIGVSVGAFVALPCSSWAACTAPVARIVAMVNAVEVREAAGTQYQPATLNMPVCLGDTLRVGESSRATLAFVDSGLRLAIEQNTEFAVRPPSQPRRSVIELLRGTILFFTRQPRSLDVRTPFVNAAVEGTEFLARVGATLTEVVVLDGTVSVANTLGSLILTGGQSAQAAAGQPPRRIDIRPQDAVRWALYYDPVTSAPSLTELERVPPANRDAGFFLQRAGALLGAGSVESAQSALAEVRQRDPENADAYALSAVIDVAQNNRTGALENARRAVARDPQSQSAAIALSYALQAAFDLEGARDALLRVVPPDARADRPEHALALARLAELWLSLGYVDTAFDVANRAAHVAPDSPRTQTVLGYAELARFRTPAATAAFERAITLESGNPLAHLGRGLAAIREGRLAEGTHDIETAAALDPGDAVIRSYLGKAYFEERREGVSGEQLALAKQLDPLDPTPFLYDAIRKQAINRPVEALYDLQTSIALNDNRSVYRSRFGLDADLAARGASLGRIYRDLGFEELALVEGWKSLAVDPANFSAHRLLADTYSALPRHEVARVSELLQSQLLQPLTLTPVSPRLAETDLFILAGAGPAEPGFNEFNSLFVRNRIAAQFSGAIGQRSLSGEELTVSILRDNFSLSLGQFHYDTEGFRQNNAQDRDIYNVFAQARLSVRTSVQAEFRSRDSITGDLNLLFNADDFSQDERIETTSRLGRVGVRHVFSPNSQVIVSVYAAHDELDAASSFDQLGETGTVASLATTDSGTVEVRHLLRAKRWTLTTGGGRFQSARTRNERLDIQLPFPPFSLSSDEQFDDDPRHTNLYAYSHVGLSQFTVTLGSSADFYESQLFSRNQFNPKVGVVWNPQPSTTVRLAAFRTLQRTLVASQTVEPTQVAGFNQFFSDSEGETSWRYGVAADRKFSDALSGGAEVSWRDLTLPIEIGSVAGETEVRRFGRSEQMTRCYIYWARPELAVSAEYFYERFDRNPASSGSENILKLRTHRIPVGARYFSPSGLFVKADATYVKQQGDFAALAFAPHGEDQFWVVDAAAGYRLPRAYGRLALEIKNLFDARFQFQDTDPGNPSIKPRRLAVLTFTVGI